MQKNSSKHEQCLVFLEQSKSNSTDQSENDFVNLIRGKNWPLVSYTNFRITRYECISRVLISFYKHEIFFCRQPICCSDHQLLNDRCVCMYQFNKHDKVIFVSKLHCCILTHHYVRAVCCQYHSTIYTRFKEE